MTLRKKTLAIIGLTLIILFGLLYFILSTILLNGFARVEEQNTQENVRRVLEALDNQVAELRATSGDWAFWDDTYTFANGTNPDYVAANLDDATLLNLGLNLIVIGNPSGEVVYAKALDLQSGQVVAIPAALSTSLAQYPELLVHTRLDSLTSGIILLPEGPLMVASDPILTSARTGPIAGTLIMGRYLDEARLSQLAAQTHYGLAAHRLDQSPLPPDFEAALTALKQAGEPFVRPLDQETIAGYTLLSDVKGRPALVMRVESPRAVFAQGQVSLGYLIVALLVLGLVFVLLTLALLERLVLARLAQLSAGVEQIGISGDLARRLTLGGRDELAALAAAINNMLQALQEALVREKQLKSEIQALRIEIDQAKRQKQVAEIVESDFFRDLQNKSAAFRRRRQAREAGLGTAAELPES